MGEYVTAEERPKLFRSSRVVHFGDCDPAGIIWTPRAADYLIEAAFEFFAFVLRGPTFRTLEGMGVWPPVRRLTIDYLAPLTYDDELEMSISGLEIGARSITSTIDASKRDGQVAIRGTLTQVCVDPRQRTAVEIPQEFRKALIQYRSVMPDRSD